ncbi:uncharacterized protein PAF06_010341 [Gastrophryne carolinensis]
MDTLYKVVDTLYKVVDTLYKVLPQCWIKVSLMPLPAMMPFHLLPLFSCPHNRPIARSVCQLKGFLRNYSTYCRCPRCAYLKDVKTRDEEHLVGTIKCENNRFTVTFPLDLEVTMKAMLLASCFYLEFVIFTERRFRVNRSHDRD